ncbi:MAG: hypothetical protein JRI39_00410 [Deltaproteobacteria bacterium]|nr:hypothetical protein [Deltaproteobacteria bacterium]
MRRDQTKRAWKVVRYRDGRGWSPVIDEPRLKVCYELGKWSFPFIGKLFVFADSQGALDFYYYMLRAMSHRNRFVIFQGLAVNLIHEPGKILYLPYKEDSTDLILKYWKKGPTAEGLKTIDSSIPETAVCDRFLPLTDVTKELQAS